MHTERERESRSARLVDGMSYMQKGLCGYVRGSTVKTNTSSVSVTAFPTYKSAGVAFPFIARVTDTVISLFTVWSIPALGVASTIHC